MSSAPTGFGRYQLGERLAVGGMAELFKARVLGAHGFHKPVVIKKILPHLAADPTFVSMFIDEANITARLDHPKIAQVLELGTIDGSLFIAMEYVDGRDLLAVMRAATGQGAAIPAHHAVHIAHEVLDALDYAHHANDEEGRPLGVVHRDISPSNVLISRRGDVKLADFGIARAAQRRQQTEAGMLKGKYHYMSPEQVMRGPLDARSDLFSVGIVLAEMLTGRHLFKAASDLDVLLMVREARLDRLDRYGSRIDPGLKAILLRALQRNVEDRFPSAKAFRDALADWLFARHLRVGPGELADWVVALLSGHLTPTMLNAAASTSGPNPFPLPGTPSPNATPVGPPRPVSQTDSQFAYRSSTMLPVAATPTPAPPPTEDDEDVQITIEQGSDKTYQDITAQAAMARVASPAMAMGASRSPSSPSIAPPRAPASTAVPSARVTMPPVSSSRTSGPNVSAETGDFKTTSAIRMLHRLAAAKETGLLVADQGQTSLGIYLVGGAPESVPTTAGTDGFGRFLLEQKVISDGELSMAMAMRPHFGGSLGEAMVGLGLLSSHDLVEKLRRYVRHTTTDLLGWTVGLFHFHRGRRNAATSIPLGLSSLEIIGGTVSSWQPDALNAWVRPLLKRFPVAVPGGKTEPDAFGLGPYPRELCRRLNGQLSVGDHLTLCHNSASERLQLLRALRLVIETELVILS